MPVPALVKRFAAGEQVGAARLNQLVDAVNAAVKMLGSGDAAARVNLRVAAFVVDSPIDDATGFYAIRTYSGSFIGTPTRSVEQADLGKLSSSPNAVAVNLQQVDGSGLDVGEDTIHFGMIIGRTGEESDHPNQLIIAFTPPGTSIAIVKLTADAPGGEKYYARLFRKPTGGVSATGDLTEADLGSLSDVNDALFLNGEQVAASDSGTTVDNTGHVLTVSGRRPYAVGVVFGDYTTDDPPLLVVRGLSALTDGC